jgi:hypothetical protein
MLENVIVAAIVLGAVGFVFWGLSRAAGSKAGHSGCSCSSTHACPYADDCDATGGPEEKKPDSRAGSP